MKIQLLSDLHIELEPFRYPECDSDVVVLAGDIHVRKFGLEWAIKNISNKPVIYVLGNHEYYTASYPCLINELKELAKGTNVHILENEAICIDGINFLGCTLWTDFNLFGDSVTASNHCQVAMTDFKRIKQHPEKSPIKPADTAKYHKQSKAWLTNALEQRKGETNVVVTHHGPSIRSAPKHLHDDLTIAGYASDMEGLIQDYTPDYWLHGHLHYGSDYQIGNCRVLCNPRGYYGQENQNFHPLSLFTIDLDK